MNIFTVIGFHPDSIKSLEGKIEKHYKNNHYIPYESKNVWFIKSNNTTSEVSEKLGMNNDEEVVGLIIKNDLLYGFADVAIWEWEREARNE